MFDRSKYKKTSLDVIDEMVDKTQATVKNPFGGQGSRATFYSVAKEGRYVIRILPAKCNQSPYVPRKTSKLPIECPVYDKDGKDTGKKEVRNKDVFTADIHSKKMNGKDAVVTYLNYVYEFASEIQDADERKKFLAPVTGYRDKKKNWVWGFAPTLSYVAYIFADKEFYRFDIRSTWWKKMKNISIERSEEDVPSIDIFSDIEKGYPLIINTSLDNNGKTQFELSCGLPKVGQNWEDFFEANAITDEMFEILEQYPSLEDQYVDVFSRKDWNMQIEGLERIDEQYGFGIFQNDEFLNELEEIEKLVPEDNEVKQAAQMKPIVKEEKEVKEDSIPTSQEKKYPPLIKMKSELKVYIEKEYEGIEKLPDNLSVTELRKWYDLMKEGMMLPFEDNDDQVDDTADDNQAPEPEPEPEKPVRASSKVPSSIQSRLSKLRSDMRK